MNRVVGFHVSQAPLTMAVQRTAHVLSIQTKSGRDSGIGYTDSNQLRICVGDSALSNLVQARTTPQGAQMVSTQ